MHVPFLVYYFTIVQDFGTEVDPNIELADYTTTFTQSITVPGMEEALQNLTMDSTGEKEKSCCETTSTNLK